jgi:molybdopterin-guanine dinucleotide biosynthesis protein
MGLGSNLNKETTDTIHPMGGNRVIPINTEEDAYKESQLIGREKEKSEIIKLISDKGSQQLEVISVCGMGGLGKTTLVKDVYQSQELSAMFEKRACATIMHPFHLEELFSSLALQLDEMSYRNEVTDGDRMKLGAKPPLAASLEGKRYLIVLDDLSSTTEWDTVIEHFPITKTASRIIVTTRLENVAKHCSKKDNNIYMLKSLGEKDACALFTEKVFIAYHGNAMFFVCRFGVTFKAQYPLKHVSTCLIQEKKVNGVLLRKKLYAHQHTPSSLFLFSKKRCVYIAP